MKKMDLKGLGMQILLRILVSIVRCGANVNCETIFSNWKYLGTLEFFFWEIG